MKDPHTNFITGTYLQAEGTWNTKYVNLSEAFKRKETSSQNGEGGLVNEIFERCGTRNKWCVEFGVGDGFNLSNTWYLLKKMEWNGILIEQASHLVAMARKQYEDQKNVYVLQETITENNLDSILKEYPIPKNFDFISIDIDSPYDDKVWNNTTYRPNLVCIEIDAFQHDFSVESYEPIIVQEDGRVGGHSIGKMLKIGKEKGYDFLCANYCNAFFIEPEFAKPLLL